ncbi:MAG: urea carboxylase [Candidatus Azotimanducaceae bacterium]|jgi:urea carboxylase
MSAVFEHDKIDKILIANRGAIACRIVRSIAAAGKQSIAIYAADDGDSRHIDLADEAYSLGSGLVSETYLNQDKILKIADQTGAKAIHPGYGFLSENAGFEQRCAERGIAFLGPTAEQINVFGLKHSARALAKKNNVPMLPGSELLEDLAAARVFATQIGYPLMLKSTAGGGGIGMRICRDEPELDNAFDAVQQLAANNFGNAGVFIERYVEVARHVEVQVIGDGQGQVLALGTRDCSVQRRQQKVIEECPAPNIPTELLDKLCRSAESLLSAVNYRSVGTVEYIFDEDREEAYFLEVNTRLQVEHGVTEMVYGIDLVDCMIRLAEGTLPALPELAKQHQPCGHAIQARVYAEDPTANFQPSPGLLTHVSFPPITDQLRIDTWVQAGTEVSATYDPMIAKVIFHGEDRMAAIDGLKSALKSSELYGTATNLDYLAEFLDQDSFKTAALTTAILTRFDYKPIGITVKQPGTFSTVQDYPGRVGYWDVGVPPSGPFDDLSFQIGNQLLSNCSTAAGLEITIEGPTLLFHRETAIVLAGAPMAAMLNGEAVKQWQVIHVEAGSVLDMGRIESGGIRGYLLVAGGFQMPAYLGSRSTFTLGQFGGHGGRVLRVGDTLPLSETATLPPIVSLPDTAIPFSDSIDRHWELHVIYGPHGAPDFFTPSDIDVFFGTNYEVHFNSSRTGIRLIGPKPDWARNDGGEAGLHPSNIHDNAYAVGAVDFTGDMPVLLGPDGPSLGGFVCPATIVRSDLWKLGQLQPGDTIRFVSVSNETALLRYQEVQRSLSSLKNLKKVSNHYRPSLQVAAPTDAVIRQFVLPGGTNITFRPSGDNFLLMEAGEQTLDIELRFKIHGIHRALADEALPGVLELTPGIRSLQVHYTPESFSRDELIETLIKIATAIDGEATMEVPSRIVYLPLSWDDPACQEAIDKYERTVRPGAPWCPSNLDFIRRINGLRDVAAVEKIVFDATYLVMGLGDVYLGAPVATPINPAHRLVTTKYNPARTWTAENSVGIGGAYLCVYGMEGPGGYQFVGRTIQMWNRYRQTSVFEKPWLLRFFDQIRFYPVNNDELLQLRQDFIHGRFEPRIEKTTFKLSDHRALLQAHESEIDAFTRQRQQAFSEEMQDWRRSGQLHFDDQEILEIEGQAERNIPEGCFVVESHLAGNVWQYRAKPGDTLTDMQTLMVLESMKMELEVKSARTGRLIEFFVEPGQQVTVGQSLALFSEVS